MKKDNKYIKKLKKNKVLYDFKSLDLTPISLKTTLTNDKYQERHVNGKVYSFLSNMFKSDEKYLKQAIAEFDEGDFYIDQHAFFKAGGEIRDIDNDVAICYLKDKWIDIPKFWDTYHYYKALDNSNNISKSILNKIKRFNLGDKVIITDIKNEALKDNKVFVLNKPNYVVGSVSKKSNYCANKEYCSKSSSSQCISISPINNPGEVMYICECMIKKVGK